MLRAGSYPRHGPPRPNQRTGRIDQRPAITILDARLALGNAVRWKEASMDLTSLSGISTVIGAAVGLYGGYHLLFGATKVADAVKDGQGMSMNSGLGQLLGGAIIIVVSGGFIALAQTWPY